MTLPRGLFLHRYVNNNGVLTRKMHGKKVDEPNRSVPTLGIFLLALYICRLKSSGNTVFDRFVKNLKSILCFAALITASFGVAGSNSEELSVSEDCRAEI